jgi:hypothetical protein
MDDFGILGIGWTLDPAVVKEAYRARAKELHPDLANPDEEDESLLERHLRFIALSQAYRRILAGLSRRPTVAHRTQPPRPTTKAGPSSTALMPHGDPAYALYRTGMKLYMAIHPSAWDQGARILANDPSSDGGEDEVMRAKVGELILLFPRAYYYFSLVVTEYPDSPWAADARDKMETIERRSPAYARILESFGAWRRAGKERRREVENIVVRTKQLLEEEGDMKWPDAYGPKGSGSASD